MALGKDTCCKAVPMNSREIDKILRQFTKTRVSENSSWSDDYYRQRGCPKGGCLSFEGGIALKPEVMEKDPLCNALGVGCLIVAYDLHNTPYWRPGKEIALGEESRFGNSNYRVARHREFSIWSLYPVPEGNRETDRDIRKRDARNRDFVGSLKLDRFDLLREKDDTLLRQLLKALPRELGPEDNRQLFEFVATHPSILDTLPKAFAESLEKDRKAGGISARTRALEEVIANAALLVLDSFTKVADSESWFYPYATDGLVKPGSLLDLDRLYVSLQGVGRWPEIRHLSVAEREKMEPEFREQSAARYVAQGLYQPELNRISLDLTAPFFDTVYALYHELWHVLIFHSERTNAVARQVQALLQGPATPENNELLRHTLLRFFAEHELLAIDQSARLFRATGQLAWQWGAPATSAQGWTESYFGDDQEFDLLVPMSMRRMQNQSKGHWWLLPVPPLAILDCLIQEARFDGVREKEDQKVEKKLHRSASFERFLATRRPIHLNHYRERYLKGVEDFDLESLRIAYSSATEPIQLPTTIHLSCEEVRRLDEALGEQSHYGLPFAFDPLGGWDRCFAQGAKFLELAAKLKTRTGLPNLLPLGTAKKSGRR
jgi:hypothetical protein